jgi:hypothetical protein
MEAKFEKQTYGAVVATILEADNSIVEVQERNDGAYGLIVHHRREDRDTWDDLTAYLKPEHFDALGSVARRMRGEPECCKALAPDSECRCAREERGVRRYQRTLEYLWRLIGDLSDDLRDEGSDYSVDGLNAMRRRVANALPPDRLPDWLEQYRDPPMVQS